MFVTLKRHRQALAEATQENEAERRAWEIYHAHTEWVARVDTKASILLTLQGVALGVVVALTDTDKPLAWKTLTEEPLRVVLFFLGIVLLAAAILGALAVIVPQVGKRKSDSTPKDFIFFGHSRLWKAKDLEAALHGSAVGQLAEQIVILGEIAWTKNKNAKWSAWLFVAGGAILCALVAVINFAGG